MSIWIIGILAIFCWLFLAYSLRVGLPGFKRVIGNPGKHKRSPIDGDHSDLDGAFSVLVVVSSLCIVAPMAILCTVGFIITILK